MRLRHGSRTATSAAPFTPNVTTNQGRFGDLPRLSPLPPKPELPDAPADVLIGSTDIHSGLTDLFDPAARKLHEAHRPAAAGSLIPACGAPWRGWAAATWSRISGGRLAALNAG